MACKTEVLPPTTPLLCDHITEQNKHCLLISALSVYTLVATSWCRSEYSVWGRQGWSSSLLERKLTAHTTAISSSRRVCCLTSEQCRHYRLTRTAAGWSASAHRPSHDGLSEKRALQLHWTSHGLQIALILIPWITLFGVFFSNESTTNDNSRRCM